MKLNTTLAAAVLLIGGVPAAQATTYEVAAAFTDGGVQGQTLFNGSFDWDGTTVTNFKGLLSESMWGYDSNGASGAGFYVNGTGGGMFAGPSSTGLIYNKPGGYADNEAPLLELTHQLAGGTADPITGLVAVSTFMQNSTDVVMGGGYNVDTGNGGNAFAFGMPVNANRNFNGFFTLVFDAADPTDTTSTWNQVVYADETYLGMMGPMLTGWLGMTGYGDQNNAGSMGGFPVSLSISEVASVPLPAAVWLFGGALISLFGANRRRSIVPA